MTSEWRDHSQPCGACGFYTPEVENEPLGVLVAHPVCSECKGAGGRLVDSEAISEMAERVVDHLIVGAPPNIETAMPREEWLPYARDLVLAAFGGRR